MDGYIVSTVAGLAAPLKPRELARRQDGYVFAHIDPAERLVTRSQVANATIEEVRALGEAVSQAASKNIACVFGNRGSSGARRPTSLWWTCSEVRLTCQARAGACAQGVPACTVTSA